MRSSLGTLTAINGAQLFGSIATVTSQAASGLIGMSKAAAESIDAMSKLGTRAGLAYAEVAGLKYAGDLAGVGMDSIANALTKADKAFIAAGNGSKSAVDALATLGLSFEQLNGKASADRFQAIANALAAMPNTAERTAAAIGRLLAVVPEAAILWDAHHTWKKGGEDPLVTWRAIRASVVHVHVKDSVSVPSARHPFTYVLPGAGEFPMAPLRAELRAAGFAGPVSLEWERLWHPYLPSLDAALTAATHNRWW